MVPILLSCLMYSLLYFSSIVKHSNKIVVLQTESQIQSLHNSYDLEKPYDVAVVAEVVEEQLVSNNEDKSKILSIVAMETESPAPIRQEEMFGDEKELQLNER